jgi:chaperone BCS1
MIESYIAFLNALSQGNDMVAGALVMASTGVGLYVARALPSKIFNFVKRFSTISLVYDNTTHASREQYIELEQFLLNNKALGNIRTYSLNTIWDSDKQANSTKLGIGYGAHLIRHNLSLILAVKEQLDSSGSELQKERVTLYCVGKKPVFFNAIVDHLEKMSSGYGADGTIPILDWDNHSWRKTTSQRPAGLDSLAINNDIKDKFKNEFKFFMESKEEFHRLNLPYKMTYLLHGVPGSGKTSLIRALASDYSLSIARINLNDFSDDGFYKAITKVPKKSIVLIEDFDSTSSTKKRKINRDLIDSDSDTKDDFETFSFLTLSGILNTLDGIVSLNECIIFLTTNNIGAIDEALYRTGRVDVIRELPKINEDVVSEYFEKLYPNIKDKVKFNSMSAKDINGIVSSAKSDKNKAIELLNETGEENEQRRNVCKLPLQKRLP